jgi:hypothetical protein
MFLELWSRHIYVLGRYGEKGSKLLDFDSPTTVNLADDWISAFVNRLKPLPSNAS